MTSKSALLLTAATLLAGTPAWAQQASDPTQGGTTPSAPVIQADQTQTTPSDNGDVVVTGIRRSLQDSIDTKRRTNAIVDVISAEDVGKFPDTNVAESLSHLPGVTVDHQFGEGEQVSINGVEPALNRILIDGHSIASADWGGNPSDRSSRSFNYSLLSPEIISQAVVYKTPEARLQEGAIGGTVDIVTRKPLDLKPNTITATGGLDYNDRSKKANGRASVLYSWHNADDTFGFLASVNYDRETLSRAGVEVFGYGTGADYFQKDASGNLVKDSSGQPVPINSALVVKGGTRADLAAARYGAYIDYDYFQQVRQREGFTATAQWRPASNFTLTATGLIIRGKYDNLSNASFSYNTRGDLLQSATVANGLVTSETFSAGTGSEWTGELDTNFRRTRIKNDSGTVLFDWNPGGWKVTGNAGYTRASGGKSPEYLLNFRTLQGFTASAVGRATSLQWTNPSTDASQWVSTYPAEASTHSDAATLAANGGQSFYGSQIGGIQYGDLTVDREKFGQADFAHDVHVGPFTQILFGVRGSVHDNQQTTYGGATYTNRAFTLADLGPYNLSASDFSGLSISGNGAPYATLTQSALIAALSRAGTLNVSDPLDTGSFFKVQEQIVTGYVQANFEMDRFRGNIGGRFVHTRDISNFYSTYDDASGNGVTSYTTVAHNDDRFLPAGNIAFDAGKTVVLRLAAAKVIARPRFSDLAGALSLDDTSSSGSLGNPNLKPYAATNFSGSAEWYFAPGGLLAGEVFYRDISNFITNSNTQLTLTNPLTNMTRTYAISQPQNGGKASVTGFSITAQTSLIWGFGIQTNYTFANADTSIGTGLPYLSRNTINIIPYYERGPFQARLSYNRRSKYFYVIGRLSSSDYTDAYRQLDFSASYRLNANISVTANASNLLDETYYQYSSTPDAPTALYKNGRRFALTATFKM